MTTKTKKLCMIPGPVEFQDEVLLQMATPATSHVDPKFIQEFGESLEMLRKVFGCEKGQPFIVAGSGTLGWDMVASNLTEPKENALVINTGYFGDRFGECLTTYGAQVTHVRAPSIGTVPEFESIENALKRQTFKVATITHVDTSTAVLMDIPKVTSIIRRTSPSTLIVVDGVCSIGGEEMDMDAWGVDVALTASQKALGTPPGLCIVVANERAMEAFRARKVPVTSYYASWNNWTKIMNAYEAHKPSYFATPPVQLIKALHTSLNLILSQPLSDRYRLHREISHLVKNHLEKLGLMFVPRRDVAANTLTAVYYPDNIPGPELLKSISAKGVVVAGGLHADIANKYFRIGHMGYSAIQQDQHDILKTLKCVEESLIQCGYRAPN